MGVSYPSTFTRIVNRLIFTANDGTVHGSDLWATEGTPSGTVLMGDIPSGILTDESFAKINGRLFFCPGNSSGRYCCLFNTYGTPSETTQVETKNAAAAANGDEFLDLGGEVGLCRQQLSLISNQHKQRKYGL